MEPLDVAAKYYDAWKHKKGDMTDVPLAEDFSYTGPVVSFEDAAGFRAMAANAGPLEIRDGRLVRGENIYDAEPMRQAMAQAAAEA